MALSLSLLVVVVLLSFLYSSWAIATNRVSYGGGCPSMCNGHGICAGSSEYCTCYEGWGGGDCSLRLCPAGIAWIDYAWANGTAHASHVPCSNMGYCDYETGVCSCREGFIGEACQRVTCPGTDDATGRVCNGNGRCLTMREAAQQADFVKLVYEGNTYDEWDADKITGCVCDEGWEGYDCSLLTCPWGVDPWPVDEVGVDERQVLDCTCPWECSGSVRLEFLGYTTEDIPWDASAELVKFRLEQLFTVQEVSVEFHTGTEQLCSGPGSTTTIDFLLQRGDVWNITVDAASLSSSSGSPTVEVFYDGDTSTLNPSVASIVGTKVETECSNRGFCSHDDGICMCYEKFLSSDGKGAAGFRGDCAYVHPWDPPTNCTLTKTAWGEFETEQLCSGYGTCNTTTLRCDNCTQGTSGSACHFLDCPSGISWFDEAINGSAHTTTSLCSDRGLCDYTTGTCECDTHFAGDNACSRMSCSDECNEHGECATIREFAGNATVNGLATVFAYDSWDADKLATCMCNRSMAVDNVLSGTSDTFRGPYAYADTDWQGFDCSRAHCPLGHDWRVTGVNEVQHVNCSGEYGAFTLSFRGEMSDEIVPWARKEDVEATLESLNGINDVSVWYNSNSTEACNDTNADNFISVEFITEHGDVPNLVPHFSALFMADQVTPGSINVSQHIQGTKLNLECSAHGICDESTGICDCFVGYQGGDGVESAGQRGDCSWRNKWQTMLFQGRGSAADQN